ncbi:hypothetical protein [Collimonas sp. PA-H2]|uniref:hypothetical protein n=1 Tax=Collimonas sp. PA-H2 TaxID=1881062 RepID=UPI000BF2DDEE|nr:hypothetical protein [Collimonas sp. PA-H2]
MKRFAHIVNAEKLEEKLTADFQGTQADDNASIHMHAEREKCEIVARKKVEARRMLEDALEEIRQRQAEWSAR